MVMNALMSRRTDWKCNLKFKWDIVIGYYVINFVFTWSFIEMLQKGLETSFCFFFKEPKLCLAYDLISLKLS